MRILFAGTPAFAAPALQVLIRNPRWCPVAVLTQPDRAAGRGRKLRIGPIKQLALDAGLPVLQPSSLKSAGIQSELAELQPDLLVTAAYGLLLPPAVLDLPRHGCWNLHASLLPRWRGASPIHQTILAGDAQSGISLMQMDVGLDTGPVLLQRALDVGPEETTGQLHDRLAPLAAELLTEGLQALEQGKLPPARPQDESLACHAPLISKADAELDWQQDAEALARQVRGYHPWPVAQADIDGQRWRIHQARAAAGQARPGALLPERGPDVVAIGCGRGVLEILQLQEAGRKPVQARDWHNARRNQG